MSIFLLDVNFLVALSWPAHDFHDRAHHWFRRHSSTGWATCSFTQTSFVRLLSNPAFSPHAVSPREAVKVLNASLQAPGHRFWVADLSFQAALDALGGRVVGHQQVTDAYLLGLAIRKRGKLATFDQHVKALLPVDRRWQDFIELVL